MGTLFGKRYRGVHPHRMHQGQDSSYRQGLAECERQYLQAGVGDGLRGERADAELPALYAGVPDDVENNNQQRAPKRAPFVYCGRHGLAEFVGFFERFWEISLVKREKVATFAELTCDKNESDAE